jgi:hypothetical protein
LEVVSFDPTVYVSPSDKVGVVVGPSGEPPEPESFPEPEFPEPEFPEPEFPEPEFPEPEFPESESPESESPDGALLIPLTPIPTPKLSLWLTTLLIVEKELCCALSVAVCACVLVSVCANTRACDPFLAP